jgi:hypothetical protein
VPRSVVREVGSDGGLRTDATSTSIDARKKEREMTRNPLLKSPVELAITFAILAAAVGLLTSSAAAQDGNDGSPGGPLGSGTELIYANCYEQVAGFRVPLAVVQSLVGSALPAGFTFRTSAGGTLGQFNVVGIDCEQGGHGVTDVFINVPVVAPEDFPAPRPAAVRARAYTNSPASNARYGIFCLGHATTLADAHASVEIDPSTGVRRGRVVATDGVGSVVLQTTTAPPPAAAIGPATLQHLTVEDGEVRGRIEWGSSDLGLALPVADGQATAVIDGVSYVGFGGQHVFAPDGDSATFFHRGHTSCAPGLDWND